MFWLKFVLFCIWMSINSPLRFVVSFLQRVLWFPYFNEDIEAMFSNHINLNTVSNTEKLINNYSELEFDKVEIDDYLLDNDGAKFMGMAYVASEHMLAEDDSYSEHLWENIKMYFNYDTFIRTPFGENDINFSGDMLSGMLFAIYHRYILGKLSIYDAKQLYCVFKNVIINNFFMFPHEDKSRGRILTWWAFGHEWIQAKATLKVMVLLSPNEKKWKILYHILNVLSYPSRMCPDYGIFISNFTYLAWWYPSHSTALYAYVLKDVYTLKVLNKRYPGNLDISTLLFILDQSNRNSLVAMFLHLIDVQKDYYPRNVYVTEEQAISIMGDTNKMWSLKKMKWNEEMRNNPTIIPSIRGEAYAWERCPAVHVSPDNTDHSLDVIFPIAMFVSKYHCLTTE